MLRSLNVCEPFFPLSCGCRPHPDRPKCPRLKAIGRLDIAPDGDRGHPPHPAGNLVATTAMKLAIGADLSVFSPGLFLLLSQKINKIP